MNIVSCSTACPPSLAAGCRLEQLLRQHRPLWQSSRVPKSASRCNVNSSFPFNVPELRSISVVSISTHEYGQAASTLPVSCSPSASPVRAIPQRGAFFFARTALCVDISESKLHDICIPISSGINSWCRPWSLIFRDLWASRLRRLLLFSGTVKP